MKHAWILTLMPMPLVGRLLDVHHADSVSVFIGTYIAAWGLGILGGWLQWGKHE